MTKRGRTVFWPNQTRIHSVAQYIFCDQRDQNMARSGFQQQKYYAIPFFFAKTNSSGDNRESVGGSPTSLQILQWVDTTAYWDE